MNCPILSADEFSLMLNDSISREEVCVVFICAVNANRIYEFLSQQYAEFIDIVILPPDCQNRRN